MSKDIDRLSGHTRNRACGVLIDVKRPSEGAELPIKNSTIVLGLEFFARGRIETYFTVATARKRAKIGTRLSQTGHQLGGASLTSWKNELSR